MAIEVTCKECGKKFTLDEAFAGGMCRCPHCSELFVVDPKPPSQSNRRGDRPEVPPASDDEDFSPENDDQTEEFTPPVGKFLRFVALIIMLAVVAMIVGGIAIVFFKK